MTKNLCEFTGFFICLLSLSLLLLFTCMEAERYSSTVHIHTAQFTHISTHTHTCSFGHTGVEKTHWSHKKQQEVKSLGSWQPVMTHTEREIRKISGSRGERG